MFESESVPVAVDQVKQISDSSDFLLKFNTELYSMAQGAVLLTVGRSYVGNDVTHSTLLDRACAYSYENLPKYRSYRVSNAAPEP